MLLYSLMLLVLLVMILLFSVNFYSICPCCVYESVGEVLKFTAATAHKIDVVSKL